jgi:hypothetical protein
MKNLIKSLALVGVLTAVGVTVASAQLTLSMSTPTYGGSETAPYCSTDSGHFCLEWNHGVSVPNAGSTGSSVQAQSRYYSVCGYKTKSSSNSGSGAQNATTDYNIPFSVNVAAGAVYNLQIDQSRQGFMAVINNNTTGTATCSGVAGDLTGGTSSGTLATAALGNINGQGGQGISQTATAYRTGVTGTGSAQNYTLHFTWTQSGSSLGSIGYTGGDSAVQMGYGDCNGDISSDDYSQFGHNAATDGHWVTVTATVTAPSPPTVGNNGPVCVGATLGLTASSAFSPVTWSWTGPNGFTSSAQNPTVSTSATTAMAGTYSCTVTWSGHTSGAATTVVTVKPLPTPGTISLSQTMVCSGFTTTATLSGYTGGSSIQWYTSTDGGTTATPVGSNSPTYTSPALTVDTWFAACVTYNGCTSCVGWSKATVGDITPPTIIAPADIDINL